MYVYIFPGTPYRCLCFLRVVFYEISTLKGLEKSVRYEIKIVLNDFKFMRTIKG